eukprot:6194649-Pleurochrysis_carterae.AAC.5
MTAALGKSKGMQLGKITMALENSAAPNFAEFAGPPRRPRAQHTGAEAVPRRGGDAHAHAQQAHLPIVPARLAAAGAAQRDREAAHC